MVGFKSPSGSGFNPVLEESWTPIETLLIAVPFMVLLNGPKNPFGVIFTINVMVSDLFAANLLVALVILVVIKPSKLGLIVKLLPKLVMEGEVTIEKLDGDGKVALKFSVNTTFVKLVFA